MKVIIIIIIAVILVLVIIAIRRYAKFGSSPIFLSSYKILKDKLPNDYPDRERFILMESFKPFRSRKPFNTLSDHDVNEMIDVLSPWPELRPGLMAALLFMADKYQNAMFLKNKEKILPILKEYYKNGKGDSIEIYSQLTLNEEK